MVAASEKENTGLLQRLHVIVAEATVGNFLQQQMISKFPFLAWNGIPEVASTHVVAEVLKDMGI